MLLYGGAVRDPDKLTARVFDSATRSSGCRLETYRDGDTFFIDIDLPGVDPADIDFAVDGRQLTVRVSRREGLRLAAPERPEKTRTRQISLADTLDTDRHDARYEKGVLTLRIPVAESGEAHLQKAA